MQKFEIHGGHKLKGSINISGAKNAALPILMTSLLTQHSSNYSNVPCLDDIDTTLVLLQRLGVECSALRNSQVMLNPSSLIKPSAPYDLVKSMRASILVLGPLLAKYGRAKVALPGGCAIGARPVDLHINGMEALGAKIVFQDGYLVANAVDGLVGTNIRLKQVSVGATENLIMAATLAKGETKIFNAAREPEIVDLVKCLKSMGALIAGAGSECITIQGVNELQGANHQIQPDRIETGTYLVAAAITAGCILVRNTDPSLLASVLFKLEECGAQIKTGNNWISLDMNGRRPIAVDINTEPYPGFPTDMQAQFMALNSVAIGQSTVTENIFENRFMQVEELIRMGANISVQGNRATCRGVEQLNGAAVMSTDLRASASLIIAGLAARGHTSVDQINHTDRGYEDIEGKLSALGAKISRIETQNALSA